MAQVFDAGQTTGSSGFVHWQDAVAELFVALEATTEDRSAFHMRVQRHMLGEVMCARNSSAQQHLFRTPSLIARGSEDCVGILLIEGGSTVVSQNDRQTRAEPGDFVLFDTFRSYELENSAGSEQIVFQVPRQMILSRLGQVGHYTATRFTRERPVQRMTFDFLRSLAHNAGQMDAETAQLLLAQGLDLLALSLYDAQHAQVLSPSTHRSTLLYRVKACIKSLLSDSELSADTVGARLGISGRYVNSLLADEHTAFRHYVLACRLERCQQDLRTAAHAHRRVGEIAYAWGFNDLAHFSRVFKARFGQSPRDWRKAEPEGQ